MNYKINIEKIIIYLLCENVISKKYRLHQINKYLKLIDFDKIRPLSERINNYEKINIQKNDTQLNSYIENFIKVVENSTSNINLDNLYKNIKWLEFKICRNIDYSIISKTYGTYDFQTNQIHLVKNFSKATLYHELFHMASNNTSIKDESVGFKYDLGDELIGLCLNEGYTELLVERYFEEDYKNDIMSAKKDLSIEKRVANSLNNILGKDNMENAYFNSDLFSIINLLQEYYSKKEIIQFLVGTDFIYDYIKYKYGNKEIDIIKQQLEFITCFLIKGYSLKLVKENNNEEKNKQLIIDFIEKLGYCWKINKTQEIQIDINLIKETIYHYLGINIDLNISQNKGNVL